MNKILIIDDNVTFVEAMKVLLTDSGFEIVTAHNGTQALELLTAMQALPSLILLDLVMPVMNGFDFRKTQLETNGISHIPVILLTANDNFRDYKDALQAFEFLNKPVEAKDLLYIVESFFFLKKRSPTFSSQI